ncbi:MAG: gliding motility-associated C-terminal domain-containing protein [Psychroserpens sp.]|nr:gliding motility-associated C-terminal domain-containing protein [Psychroserpens sp.]
MLRKGILLILSIWWNSFSISGQTTDLAVLVEAQNTSNIEVSQVHIYQEFQYLLTFLNSGDLVENATFLQEISANAEVLNFEFQNPSGGAGIVTDFFLDPTTNNLSGTISSLPPNSSIEVKVTLIAPTSVGGIATNVIISPPENTEDTDLSNNQSIISIDVTDVDIDFRVELNQIDPIQSVPISAWGDDVTYQFTITNNSGIAFPITGYKMNMVSNPVENGEPFVQIQSLECISTTNGVVCPDDINFPTDITMLEDTSEILDFNEDIVFPISGSITFEIIVKFLEGECAETPDVINIESVVEIDLDHDNVSPNESNITNTLLLEPEACLLTELIIETEVIQPTSNSIDDWDDIVIFETVVSNLGTFPVPIRFFLQNLTTNAGSWNLISVTCTGTTGGLNCSDVQFALNENSWNTLNFEIPAGATITVETVLNFVEPDCNPNPQLFTSQTRSAINIIPDDIIDIDYSNNFDDDFVVLLPVDGCPASDLTVIKTQINPELPLGETENTPMAWGDVTYEIIASNISDEDTFMTLIDLYASTGVAGITGILRSIECVSTSGGATCGSIAVQNIDIPIDQNSPDPIFWEITEDDNWFMPAGSTVTFRTVHSWIPNCDTEPVPARNNVNVAAFGGVPEGNITNNGFSVTTYFTPCVDLIIQTFPSASTTPVNSTFNWIVDITNSNTSSTAINAEFFNEPNPAFTVVGTPSCQVEIGTGTCIPSFDISGNILSGVIPLLEAASSIRITIPVEAPNFGGVFNNTAEVIPSAINNEEITPETNISISNVQIISPVLNKSYTPDTIFTGNESTLTFTVNNTSTNPAQTDISFLDDLGPDLRLASVPDWVEANGCNATFIGAVGDNAVGVTDLSFPEGVESCSFSVQVTSDVIGEYLNNNLDFSNQNNIDTTQTEATLFVIEDTSNVDIEVLKSVSETSVSLFDEVSFTITATNIGTTTGTDIELIDNLPPGYEYVSHETSLGNYDDSSGSWMISGLNPNQTETLTLVVRVISSEDLLNVVFLNQVNEIDRDPSNNEDSAETSVNDCLKIGQGISPNDDGANDVLFIPCIELFPENKIQIYNRYGTLVFKENGYLNNWDGTSNQGTPNGSLLRVGTYFYNLELSADHEPIVGWVYLNY